MTSRYLPYIFLLLTGVMLQTVNLKANEPTADELETLHNVLISNAGLHAKGLACRRLAVVGNHKSIPILAGLLADEKLAHFARTGLEAIVDPAVDTAFRSALGELKEAQFIGVVNSIGNRRDTNAVEPLIANLEAASENGKAAIMSALGRIASPEAAAHLHKLLDNTRNAPPVYLCDACLQCADAMMKENRSQEAIVFYDAVRISSTSPIIRSAATLSAMQARGATDLQLFEQQLGSHDDNYFAIALQASRHIAGSEVAEMILAELRRATPERQALLIPALADRGFRPALPVIMNILKSKSAAARKASILALELLGDVTVLEPLLAAADSDDQDLANAAMNSLTTLGGEEVDAVIIEKLNATDPSQMQILLRLVGSRRIISAIPILWMASKSSNAEIRRAALQSLGKTVKDDDLNRLISRVLETPSEDRGIAVKALTSACRRASDPDGHVARIADQFSSASLELQTQMYDILSSIGGSAALRHTILGATDERDVIQDSATRVLGEWPTADVAPELLKLATILKSSKYRIRAIRGYIRVIRQFGLPADQRLEMARKAMGVATRNQEKVLVLHALLRFRNVESMNMAIEYLDTPGLEPTAAQVAIYISDQIGDIAEIRRVMQVIVEADVGESYSKQAREILIRISE